MGKRIGRCWRRHIQRDSVYKIPVFVKNINPQFQKALVPVRRINSNHIHHCETAKHHKEDLKGNQREKTDYLQRNDNDTARRFANGNIRSLKTVLKSIFRDFPGGAVVKNPPADEGETGLSPGRGRSHMPRSN